MGDDEVIRTYELLYDLHVTCELVRCIAAMKPRGTVTAEIARDFFARFDERLDDELRGYLRRYCDSVGEWLYDRECEARAEEAFNAVGLNLRLARGQLLQRGIEWRRIRPKVPTTNALF